MYKIDVGENLITLLYKCEPKFTIHNELRHFFY